jgi:hypothetical protein
VRWWSGGGRGCRLGRRQAMGEARGEGLPESDAEEVSGSDVSKSETGCVSHCEPSNGWIFSNGKNELEAR